MGKIDYIPSGGGNSGGSGGTLKYAPHGMPLSLSQGDEIIVEHPALSDTQTRRVSVRKSLTEAGLTHILSSFDLADATDISLVVLEM